MTTQETERATLIDNEGLLTPKFESALGYIFSKYAKSRPEKEQKDQDKKESKEEDKEGKKEEKETETENKEYKFNRQELDKLYLQPKGMESFGIETNGDPLSQEQLQEIADYLDVTPEGWLTFEGFCQLYSLQTGSDEDETWRDLKAHGFKNSLELSKKETEQ